MNFELAPEQKEVREMARKFCEREIIPIAEKYEREEELPEEVVRKMADQGFFGAIFPKEYGGSELGFGCHVIIAEEVSRALAALGTFFNMAGVTVPLTILNWGNEEQKKKYIPPIISGKIFGCFGLTEPNAGTDAAALQTTARKDGDVYILNGTKIWITNATIFGAGLCFARTDPKLKHRGISAFIVERSIRALKPGRSRTNSATEPPPLEKLFLRIAQFPKRISWVKKEKAFFMR